MNGFDLRHSGLSGAVAGAHRAIGFRPRLWPTVFALPVLVLLLALGVWQVQRLHWKEGLIAERQAATSAAPVPVPASLDRPRSDMEFRHVFARGVFLNDKEIYVYAAPRAGEIGFDVLTPLVQKDGQIVFVNRGFVPVGLRDPEKRAAGEIAGPVRVAGLLRLPPAGKPNWFVPANDPRHNRWFWIDLANMAAADGLSRVAPFYVDADATPNPGGWPEGGLTRVHLPNNHLQYALTWFSLAVALLVIYVLYHRKPGAR
ncbi:MAG TPA: SURF1 family protein [Stellaceae bacterium]|nr:SURF1 family protein [Stellaceae bacterium]